MRFFSQAKKTEGWLALVFQRDGVAAASVRLGADGKPLVTGAAFFPGTGAGVLEKAVKELDGGNPGFTTVLAGGNYQLMSVEAPNVARDEMRTAVRWRLKDILDFPVDDATIDILEIPLDPNAAVRPQQSIFAVAARNSVVKERQALFTGARIKLGAIDIPETAQRNVSAMLEPEGRGLAMLSFGEDGGLLTITWRGQLYLSRRIDATLAQLLDADAERRQAVHDKITLELQRSLDNFERQFSFISVAKLVLAPTGEAGLQAYLSGNLYTRVETLDLGTLFDLDAVPELRDPAAQGRYFVPIGAALRGAADGAQQINLFNPAFQQQKKFFTSAAMAATLGVLTVALVGTAIHGKLRVAALQADADAGAARLEEAHKRLAEAETEFAARKADPLVAQELSRAQADLLALKRVAGRIEGGELGNTEGYAEYFRALARQRVEGLWLTGVNIAGAGREIGVRGRAMDAALVPGFLGRLRNERIMQGKPVGSLQIGEAPALKVVKDGKEAAAPAPYVEFSVQSAPQVKKEAQP
jgi:MSHA biogenesis protein MshI